MALTSIVQKYVFLARIQDQPRRYAYRLNAGTRERLGKLAGAAMTRFLRHLGRPALTQEWQAAAADARFLAQRFGGQRPAALVLAARWKLFRWGLPLDYVLGRTPFGGLNIQIRRPVLIPRADTQLWAEELVRLLPADRPLRILEVGTGSGCLALFIASRRRQVRITAIDILPAAVRLARENARRNAPQLGPGWEGRLEFIQCNVFSDADVARLGAFDMVISNPPYVPTRARSSLVAPSVRRWEASVAVLGAKHDLGSDGLDLHRRILQLARKTIRAYPDAELPRVCLELNGSHEQVQRILLEAAQGASLDPDRVRIIPDTGQLPRAIFFFKSSDRSE